MAQTELVPSAALAAAAVPREAAAMPIDSESILLTQTVSCCSCYDAPTDDELADRKDGLAIWPTPLSRLRGTRRQLAVARRITAMIPPMSALTVLVVGLTLALDLTPDGSPPFSRILPGRPPAAASAGAAARLAFANAGCVMVLVAGVSYTFALFFWRRKRALLHGLMAGAFCVPVVALVLYAFLYCVPGADVVTAAVVAWNVGAACAWCVVHTEFLEAKGWRCLPQAALVTVALATAWPFLCMDGATLWATLACLACWDILAVVLPFGAIHVVLKLVHEEGEPLPRGLMYETATFNIGTGDLLFYAVVIGRGAIESVPAAAATALGITAGVCATVALSLLRRRLIFPALPLALALGCIGYFGAAVGIAPMLEFHRSEGAYL